MKIFVISDIHGSLSSFRAAMDAFTREGAELLVICGDYLNHGPRNDIPAGYDTKGLAKALNEVKHLITGVRGNCDSEVDQMMLEFPVLAPYMMILVPDATGDSRDVRARTGAERHESDADRSGTSGGRAQNSGVRRIFVHHGHLMTAEEAARLNTAGTVIVSGHTHVPVLERYEPVQAARENAEQTAADRAAGYILLNPGSVSIPKGGSEPGYAIIEVAAHGMKIRLCTLLGKVLKELVC